MSEPKEIPSAILDAATTAIIKLREEGGVGFVGSMVIAKVALEAAGVAKMLTELAGLRFLVAEQSPLIAEVQAKVSQLKAQVANLGNIYESVREAMAGECEPTETLAQAIVRMRERTAGLQAELAFHQESQFHPDWSQLESTRESLRESWERIRELELLVRKIVTAKDIAMPIEMEDEINTALGVEGAGGASENEF